MMQLSGNMLATRTRRNSIFVKSPHKNPALLAAAVWSISLAAIIVYASQSFLGSTAVPAKYWFIPIPMGLLVLVLDEIRKWIVRSYPDSLLAKLAW